MEDNLEFTSSVTSSVLPSELVEQPSELVERTNELAAINLDLPSESRLPSKSLQPLISKIDKLLSLRIKNELRVLELIDGSLVSDDGMTISDKAVALHKSSKDSISELVKVKMTLEGLSTENKSVTHRFDTNGLLEALREARGGRVARGGAGDGLRGRASGAGLGDGHRRGMGAGDD